MKTNELRQAYLDFFRTQGHRICPSDVLVPTWDASVLFTPAGMNQFKDHFLGKVKLEFTRAASCQKCLRTGDIDNVGRTPYHHTFFEMLGNFSFGDYFKREAIAWAWEFLTDSRWLGLAPERLSATVYLDDDEAYEIWHRDIGLPPSRISRRDESENFWPASAPSQGPDGVCGPCSEIYYHPASGGEVEIWNLVFTQFNRVGDPPNNLKPLPSNNIDTGMGLERAAATLQGVGSNYDIDILKPIVSAAADVCGVRYEFASDHGRRLRRITDHVRACTFAIHENVYPGPNKEQYVVKRLLRRAVLDGRQIGVRQPFLHRLVPAVVAAMSQPYPELRETAERVAAAIEKEEAHFFATIDAGLARIDQIFSAMRQRNQSEIDGALAAELYQTYGVPAELFESLGGERGLTFDWGGYRREMERHSVESGKLADTVMGSFGPIDQLKSELKSTTFLGYDATEARAVIRGIVRGEVRFEQRTAAEDAAPPDSSPSTVVVLDQSPFYGEAGGQVGDTGWLIGPRGRFEVRDTQRDSDLILHYGSVIEGSISLGETVVATVDESRRSAIRRAHSATHILHHALRKQLGGHAQQRGSKVDGDWLRFDFTNLEPVSAAQLNSIEEEALTRIGQAAPVHAEILPLSEAKQRGAMMLFGEKYPDPVRMISMGDFSRELCGGTHLANISEIGSFEILSEEGVSAGTRRIVALTGERARRHAMEVQQALRQGAEMLGCPPIRLADAAVELLQRVKALRKLLASGQGGLPAEEVSSRPLADADMPNYGVARDALRQAARVLNAAWLDVPARLEALLAEAADLKRKLADAAAGPEFDPAEVLKSAVAIDSARVVALELPGAHVNALRQMIDQIRRDSARTAVFFASIAGADKIHLVAGLSRDLVESGLSAGDWVKHVAPVVGGGGGGKPDFAQAGGRQPEKIKQALQAAIEYMRSALAT
jgi:alanyl-tRNA synthetase